jgi:cysteinyl-tRNA synthetase
MMRVAEKMARLHLAPQDMFRKKLDLYSAFDVDGIPTHAADGKELSKSTLRKLQKDWEKQKKMYETYKKMENIP